MMINHLSRIVSICLAMIPSLVSAASEQDEPVSFYKEIRPIFQAHCIGCHQPAKASGEYVMTDFARMIGSGESGVEAIVIGKPDESQLIELITPVDGQAEMPQDKPPLSTAEIELVRRWVTQGAQDDTPTNAKERFDMEHPPVYSQPPIVTSIDFSPDGNLLAVAGFHEVLLHNADGSALVERLVGLSERIESLAFSPDGKRLAVTGGLPERTGELQVWSIDDLELQLSIPLTYDTLYGASWSPDGRLIAVGCTDSTVRAFDSKTGEQVFFNGAHDDWALDTVFSVDGSHLVSVGRDMTTKLYRLPTQRFIDNVTSITPGALKGGIAAVTRHPDRDEVLVGGSDGTPRIYRMHRETKRVIGDDANLIRRFPAMRGRIYDVDFAPDGKSIVCCSSLDGKGQVFTYASDYDGKLSDDLRKILEKRPVQFVKEEREKVEAFVTEGAKVNSRTEIPSGVYAVRFSPDGKSVVAAGTDGTIRVINPVDGSITRSWQPVSVDPDTPRPTALIASDREAAPQTEKLTAESIPEGRTLAKVEVTPPIVELHGPYDYRQLLVTGILDSGDRIDATRMSTFTLPEEVGQISPRGRLQAEQDGLAALVVQTGETVVGVPVVAEGVTTEESISYVRDVMPVISRLGCNAGTCHGSKDGKEGFKLSLRGYDPIFDVRAWSDDLKSRRINFASPDDSLMLLKATGAVPHVGGALTQPGSDYYEIIRRWITEGARLDLDAPRVAGIQVEPLNPVVQVIGAKQQIRVIATYTDGAVRDVTSEAFVESGNIDILAIENGSVVSTLRRGEAPVLARFEGAYAATTVTVMGDRKGFMWEEPDTWNRIDELVANKWQRMKIKPSGLCTDAEFIRRIYLDMTGLPPTTDQLEAFLDDQRPTLEKRAELIDQLIGSDPFVTYWTNKWADLLQVNSKFLGKEGAAAFRRWIQTKVADNTPYDQFCREILTAKGSNKENPAASYYKILREPDAMMENTTHLFLAVRFNCNKCHDHPFERWTQDQYYEMAAFFAQTGLKRDEASGKATIGGTAVEGAKPLYEVVYDMETGEINHDRTGAVAPPEFPYDVECGDHEEATRREQLADWITSQDNQYFVESYVNRLWGYLMGTGLIEPLDDIRAGNPASNPELLQYLSDHFVSSGFDVRELMRLIVNSRTYQLSVATNQWNEDDTLNYSHAKARRLPAEVLYDAVYSVTGAKMRIPGVPEGTRAAALADAATKLPDGFLDNLGRPARESACECERSSELQLGPVMALMNGPTISQAISDPENAIAKLVSESEDNEQVINEIFMRVLNRPARPKEITTVLDIGEQASVAHQQLVQKLEAYRSAIQPESDRREQARQAAIAAATADLEVFQQEIAPEEARLDQEQKVESKKLAAELTAFDKQELNKSFAKWQDEYQRSITWVPLDPKELQSSSETKLTKLPDLSILGSQPGKTLALYTVKADVNLSRITAVKLEALTHESLPMFGPGLAQDGNFVLAEIRANWAPLKTPNQVKPIAFGSARATVEQSGFAAAQAIDGRRAENKDGWAIKPGVGKDQALILTLKEPLKLKDAARLTFVLEQVYQRREFSLGRFRISVTDAPDPSEFGIPREIDRIASIAESVRTPEEKDRLLNWFKSQFAPRRAKELVLNQSRLPRPLNPGVIARQAKIAVESQPLPVEPQLERLERAVRLSEEQLQNIRLTMAQDLAWALINSPSFLFNR